MKRMTFLRNGPIFLAGALALAAGGALAADPPAASTPPPYDAAQPHPRRVDWVEHTRHTLDELKVKLNLAASQTAAWDAWSAGVMKDAHQQLEEKKPWLEPGERGEKAAKEGTTPERMARGIERLRSQTEWMQKHLVQLEAAQVRTKDFYDVLDTNQRTIFDLYWHEVFHRAGGYHDVPEMHGDGWHGGAEHCGPGR